MKKLFTADQLSTPIDRKNLKVLLDFVAASPTARGWMRDLVQAGVVVNSLANCPRDHLPVDTPGNKGNSAYVFDGKTKTIYLSFGEELGLLAPLFLHEAAHALDEDYNDGQAKAVRLDRRLKLEAELALAEPSALGLTRVIRARRAVDEFQDKRTLRSEAHAYRQQRLIVEELCQAVPGYRGYLANKNNHRYFETPTHEEIAVNYGLKTLLFPVPKGQEAAN